MIDVDASAAPNAAPVLSCVGVVKHFGGTRALRGVDFSVNAGEIHALLGANGAGKSTLIKILAHVHKRDAGEITLRGARLTEEMLGTRLSFVHQDLGLIDSMSVGENMAMAYGYPRRRGLIDWRAVNVMAKDALRKLGADPYDDPTQGRKLGSDPYDDPTQGQGLGSDPYDDPTQGRKLGSDPCDDPTQGRRIGSDPYDDPTQGRKLGSDPYDDPTRAR